MPQNKPLDILMTGASGFLGGYLLENLKDCNIIITGRSQLSDYKYVKTDLSYEIPNLNGHQFDMVVHAAGHAHVVPKTKEEEQRFYQVNVKGTQHLLRGLSDAGIVPEAIVYISSVSVYGSDYGLRIKESEELKPIDPYGLSKLQAEEVILNWSKQHKVKVAILRPPLIVGKGASGNLGNMLSAIRAGKFFNIGLGDARRSMVLAEDLANIVLPAARKGGVFNLTDGIHPSYGELSEKLSRSIGVKKPFSMPKPIAYLLALIGSVIQRLGMPNFPFSLRTFDKMTKTLTFSDQKAREELNWQPRPVLDHIDEIV